MIKAVPHSTTRIYKCYPLDLIHNQSGSSENTDAVALCVLLGITGGAVHHLEPATCASEMIGGKETGVETDQNGASLTSSMVVMLCTGTQHKTAGHVRLLGFLTCDGGSE